MFAQLARAPKTANAAKPSSLVRPRPLTASPSPGAAQTATSRLPRAFDFARIHLGPVSGKPTVISPDDPCEHEADRVAHQVMRADAPTVGTHPASTIQSKPRPSLRSAASLNPTAALKATASGGSPMPHGLLSFFQPRLDHDLKQVRLHTGDRAAEGARAVQARAFTAGSNIVFGQGEYAPHTDPGRRLLAHELTHVVQQQRTPGPRPNVLMRTPLDQLPDVEKQSLRLDTDVITNPQNLRQFFGLTGTPVLATNVTDTYEFETPQIEAVKDPKIKADLTQGLRLFALSRFDLFPDANGKAFSRRLRMVHLESLDLSRFGGPKAAFRFTSLGTNTKGAITIRILIEEIAAPVQAMADPAETPDVEKRKVVPYGLKRGASVTDPIWQKILRSLGTIDESLIMRVRDITFETSSKPLGPRGEPADFDFSFKTGPWTKTITLFQKMISASDPEFATLLAHELGHAIDAAPAEKPGGKIAKGEAHTLPEFKEAAKKDGGRAKSITQYGTTSDSEFYAECLSLFVQQPETLRALRPNIYLYFFKYEWAAVRDPKLNAPSLFWSSTRNPFHNQ